MMGLKNYSTKISYEKTIMEIEQILSKGGSTNIFKQYENGVPKKIAFQYLVKDEPMNFVLPMEEDKILKILKENKRVPGRDKNLDQARRVGWRIIKDWIDSQMALIEINLVKFEQVFLPYMYDMRSSETLFERLEKKNFNLRLEHKEDEDD